MTSRAAVVFGTFACVFWLAKGGEAAPSVQGSHPRLFLRDTVIATLKAQASDSTRAVSRMIAQCNDAIARPGNYPFDDWGPETVETSCALAYRVTGDAKYVAPAVRALKSVLKLGDSGVAGDSGYYMRVYPPYAAIAFDWLYDRPEIQELKSEVVARFNGWFTWYKKNGYLPHRIGSNYQAGYLFASAMMAIAIAGDGGTAGDQMWSTVVDELQGKDMAEAAKPGGLLTGGDWPEGWQYGPLAVLEYSLTTRALEEQGISLPYMHPYIGELILRQIYGKMPDGKGIFIGGDYGDNDVIAPVHPWTVLAVLVGPAGDAAKSWARAELATPEILERHYFKFLEALAEADDGPTVAYPKDAATAWTAKSTRTVFARSSWDPHAVWGAFTCGPRLVEDHQHVNAGNWVMSRGGDYLVVDPTPYGSLSTLNGNAPAVDSIVAGRSPSQQWSLLGRKTDLVWTRAATGNIVAARGDYADQFSGLSEMDDEVPSDVPLAIRDWIFIPSGPDGTIVLVDRVRTGQANRGAHFRVRSLAKLRLDGAVASGTLGNSSIHIRHLWPNNASPAVRTPPKGESCDSSNGRCDVAKYAVDEVKLDVSGPDCAAITVVDATSANAPAPPTALLTGPGFRGAVFQRAATQFVIVTSDRPDASPGEAFTYLAPSSSVHIVLDVPSSADGKADVTAIAKDTQCEIRTTAHANGQGGMEARPLMIAVSASCELTALGSASFGLDPGIGDASVPGAGQGDAGFPPAPGTSSDASAQGNAAANDNDSGCGCVIGARAPHTTAWLIGIAALALSWLGRIQRRSSTH